MRTSKINDYEFQKTSEEYTPKVSLGLKGTTSLKISTKEEISFVNEYYARISRQFPYHINAVVQLLKEKDKSFSLLDSDLFLYRAHIVEQSVKCLFGTIDNVPNKDKSGYFHVERIQCQFRGRCKWNGYSSKNKFIKCVICNPVLANDLSQSEHEVADLLVSPYTIEQIAHIRRVSSSTIRAQRLSIYRKLKVNSRKELIELLKNQRLR